MEKHYEISTPFVKYIQKNQINIVTCNKNTNLYLQYA